MTPTGVFEYPGRNHPAITRARFLSIRKTPPQNLQDPPLSDAGAARLCSVKRGVVNDNNYPEKRSNGTRVQLMIFNSLKYCYCNSRGLNCIHLITTLEFLKFLYVFLIIIFREKHFEFAINCELIFITIICYNSVFRRVFMMMLSSTTVSTLIG